MCVYACLYIIIIIVTVWQENKDYFLQSFGVFLQLLEAV